MTISAISSGAATTQAKPMGMEDFLKVLLTQLVYQDPLKPMDNQEFMAQMAQFTSLEQTEQLNEKMSTLIANQAALQSVGLIGRTVDIATSGGPITGQVAALSLSGDVPSMTVTTSGGVTIDNVSLSQITAVR
ncbi:flagellar hook assembly protein FlgD [Ramlibacter solisilvae]|uniref:Basal-body rod modification protein FlgD n=1 Tax=Ramlibacter tataouinensis TaxID=94132 RepID=A0A127JQM2_9BURK|nr:flagellar hook capping FlgD N-terminal domain-containing protein [Ramlibacter tataouinensis]AMO22193.1 flagellar hook capping protein [Ramlibacter tataouinensis]